MSYDRPTNDGLVNETGRVPTSGLDTSVRDDRVRVAGEQGATDSSGRYDDTRTANGLTASERTPTAATDPRTGAHSRMVAPTAREVRSRQRDQFGGVKAGSAFFGFLTATGVGVLLVSLVAAAGTAIGISTSGDLTSAVNSATTAATSGTSSAQTIGLWGAIALLAIFFVAYYCGGYVAGRMARFDGARQGIAVWVWSVVVAAVIAVVAAIAGSKYDVLARLNLPRIPVNEGDVTTAGIISLIVVVAVSLIAAILGGLAGMHFHRKVDRDYVEGTDTI